jgi:ubiquinone/menaquinone biosynthesis C-methylase UbiE
MDTTLFHTIAKDPDFDSKINENDFWTDGYISEMILKQQLDPTYEGGSRLYSEIIDAVNFITTNIEISRCETLLDLGCGPGLYSSLLCKHVNNVIGIDISQTSLNYALTKAKNESLNIEYILENIIEMKAFPKAEIVLLVYSIFGCLSFEERKELIIKINKCLPINGYFIFDVFSENAFYNQIDKRDWSIEEKGFWSPLSYLLLKQTIVSSLDMEILHRYIIIEESCKYKTFLFKEKYFNLLEINNFLNSFGFSIDLSFGSLTGIPISNTTNDIAIIARKSSDIS